MTAQGEGTPLSMLAFGALDPLLLGKNTQMVPRPLRDGSERSTFSGPVEAASGSAESCISASCTSPTLTSVELEPGSGPAGG